MSPLLLRAEPLDLPLARPFTIARGSKAVAENVLVRVEKDGVVGLGEAAPSPRYGQSQRSVLEAYELFVPPTDADPFDQASILDPFEQRFPQETAARCALETALWDWAGQRTGRPLGRLLAIDPSRAPTSSWTVSIDDPGQIEERVREASSWPILKLKLGGGEADRIAIERLRAATDRPFRVDANEAWSEDEATEKIAWLATLGCELVEQPLPADAHEAMRRLKATSPLPLVADEALRDVEGLGDLASGFHGINIKLMKTGGVRGAVRLLHAARRQGLSIMLGCFVESRVGIAAAAHLAPLAHWLDLDGAALLAEDPFEGTQVVDGRVELSGGPGLGVQFAR